MDYPKAISSTCIVDASKARNFLQLKNEKRKDLPNEYTKLYSINLLLGKSSRAAEN
jgi:hypothetical protein